MENLNVNNLNHISNSVYLVYKDGEKVIQSDKFGDVKDYLYEDKIK